MTKKKQPNAKDTRGESWVPGQKGQGGEGLSHGYGGSAGKGTGVSAPESRKRPKKNNEDFSPSLPTPEKIAKVLR